jgi:hypothetical protein
MLSDNITKSFGLITRNRICVMHPALIALWYLWNEAHFLSRFCVSEEVITVASIARNPAPITSIAIHPVPSALWCP